ncbi:MAG: hypothetical protein GC145_18865 [Caulobacter sp.]|nr:hypothetical protein [Caulobacter sp.]
MAKAQTSTRPVTVAELRRMIEETLAKGLSPTDLVLQLTLRDAALIKRSALFADDEIQFKDGVMHVLGVPATAGEVAESGLDRATVTASE